MKIIVNMACGLANRMFQYGYYLFLVKNGYDTSVDYYSMTSLAHEDVAWNRIFPNAPVRQAGKFDVLRLGGHQDILSKFCRHYLPFLNRVVQMPAAFDAPLPENDGKDKYVMGVFQNAKMVESVSEDVRRAYEFSPLTDELNLRWMHEIRSSNSVAIHVRKGADYESRIYYRNTCPVSYYENAVSLIKEKFPDARFFVFADNKDWVRKNFTGFEYTLVEGNPGAGWGSHFDMQLMSLCRHNIISNSTYAWWAAFLNKNEGKTVIAPRQWFNPESCEVSTSEQLMCKGWAAL